jgi:arylsulfatase A-like enzyme
MPRNHPNVLFVFTDQHRASAMGCYGNDAIQTPNLDRLAASGTRCENAYATEPVCGPNRGTLLTGQYAHEHGVIFNDIPLSPDIPTVGNCFQDAGYRTGYIGKWHLDGWPRDKFTPPGPRRQGFDDCWAAYNCSHQYLDAKYYRDDNPEPIEIDGYEPITQTDLATEFMTAQSDDPFCLFLSYGPPHDPYESVPERYLDRYDPDSIPLRENVEPLAEKEVHRLAAGNDIRETIAAYYAQVTAIDEQVGRLLDALERTGQLEETLVVFTSDHGDMLWSQGDWSKGHPWAESANVPLLLRWPAEIPQGAVDETLVGTVDLAPTLLEMTGCSVPESMSGIDKSDSLTTPGATAHDSIYLQRTCKTGVPRQEWRAVKTDQYTFARLQDGSDWLLYDDENDPYQHRNLVAAAEYDDERAALSAALEEWQRRLNDGFESGDELARKLGVVDSLNKTLEWHFGPGETIETAD